MRWATRVLPAEGDEDRVAVVESEDASIAVVADGAGGTGGGRDAAELVVAAVREAATNLRDEISCVDLLTDLDVRIARTGAEASVALAVVVGDRVYGASVGDCGVWSVQGATIADLTRFQRRKPLLGSRDADVIPFAGTFAGVLLLATDGLLKYAKPGEIVHALSSEESPETIADQLLGLANREIGRPMDDVGLVISQR